jgi:hypothetical protein
MNLPQESELLRVYIGEQDRLDGRPLYERIVEEARGRGLAGATVLRGIAGFGATHRLHTAKILRLSEDLPLVVEIVDAPEKIADFLPWLGGALHGGGLVTREKVQVQTFPAPAPVPPP